MILLTGGAGFIGSVTLSYFNKHGIDDIIIVDSFKNNILEIKGALLGISDINRIRIRVGRSPLEVKVSALNTLFIDEDITFNGTFNTPQHLLILFSLHPGKSFGTRKI